MTTSTAPLHHRSRDHHPVVAFAQTTRARAARLADTGLGSLDAAATETLVCALAALEDQVAELKARAVDRAHELGLPRRSGTRSTAVWLARRTRVELAQARRTTKLADSLRGRPAVRRAVCAGTVNVHQALSIHAALHEYELASIDPGLVEADLVEQASGLDGHGLRAAARRALDDLDPVGAAARAEAELEAERRRTGRTTRLSLYDDGARTHGRFVLPADKGRQLRAALEGILEPGRPADAETRRGADPEHLGRAFVDLLDGAFRSRRVSDLLEASRRLRHRRRRLDRERAA